MQTVLKIFFKAPKTRPWLVLGCMLLASAMEGVGLASLLPIISMAMDQTASTNDSPAQQGVLGLLGNIGIE